LQLTNYTAILLQYIIRISYRDTLPNYRTTSTIDNLEQDALYNLQEGLKGYTNDHPVQWILMLDETASDERIVCDFKNGKVLLGFCIICLVGKGYDMKVTNLNQIRSMAQDLHDSTCEHLHHASEVLCISIVPLKETQYHTRVVLAIPCCKKKDTSFTKVAIETIRKVWAQHFASRYGPVCCVYTDYDVGRIRIFVALYLSNMIEPTDPLYEWVTSLHMALFDRLFSSTFRASADMKHAGENVPRTYRRDTGFLVGDTPVTPVFLNTLLETVGVNKTTRLRYFKKEDCQNVKTAYEFICTMESKSLAASKSASIGFNDGRRYQDLYLMGLVGKLLFSPTIEHKKSIQEALTGLSTLSHLCLVLYRNGKTKFIPSQLYNAIQLICHEYFVTVKTCQLDPNMKKLYLFQLGTLLLL